MVSIVVGPVRASKGVVAVFGALDFGDSEDGFEGLADADEGDEFEEGFADGADEGLAGGRGLVGGFREEVGVEVGGEEGLGAADEGGERDEVPAGG